MKDKNNNNNNNNNVTFEKKDEKKWHDDSVLSPLLATAQNINNGGDSVVTEKFLAQSQTHVEKTTLVAAATVDSCDNDIEPLVVRVVVANDDNNSDFQLDTAINEERKKCDMDNDHDTPIFNNIHSRPLVRPKSPWRKQQQQQQQQQQRLSTEESKEYDDDEEEDFFTPSLRSKCMEYAFLLTWHILCLSVYVIPVVFTSLPSEYASPNYNPQSSGSSPVLDELHIMSADNHDIHGHVNESLWQVLHQIFTNDYWGRPMNSTSSHKSWRPLTVLSFRWFKHAIITRNTAASTKNHFELLGHRLFNIITHAAAAELVAILAMKLVMPPILDTTNTTTTTTTKARQQSQEPPPPPPQSPSSVSAQQQQQQQQQLYFYNNHRNRQRLLLHSITKLVFILHPTHVEMVANAANRPHLFAILFALILCDPDITNLFYFISLICGFLSAETFIFTIPATLITQCAILYQRQYHSYYYNYYYYNQSQQQPQPELLLANGLPQQQQQQQQQKNRDDVVVQRQSFHGKSSDNGDQKGPLDQKPSPPPAASLPLPLSIPPPPPPPLYRQILDILHRTRLQWLLSTIACIAYIYMRYQLDWLSIPNGLIRPAENPFFNLTGYTRIVSYAYILSIHVLKSWDLDIIGFSHEYGHACIIPLDTIYDYRFLYCIGVSVVLLTIGIYLIVTIFLQRRRRQSQQSHHQQPPRTILSTGCILYLVHLSWMLTLFPISGIVKVGTFVADRIVVPSTISFTIIVAYILTFWLLLDYNKCHYVSSSSSSSFHIPHTFKWLLLLGLIVPLSWHRIHIRTLQWMDSLPLLQSSLQTCPNSAKSHLEISKIYSGMYPQLYNLDISHMHLMRVQEIDINYCDVHQQLAHVAIQRKPPSQRHVLEFEQELLQALLCPYTMGGAMNLWKQYWDQTLNNPITQTNAAVAQRQAVQERYNRYVHTINAAIAKADREEQERERAEAAGAASVLTKSSSSNKSPFVWGSSSK